MSVTAAFTWAKRFRQTGSMVAKPMGGDRRSRLKSERDWLLRRVSAAPSLTLAQLHEELRARGIWVGRLTLQKFLKKANIEVEKGRTARRGVRRTARGRDP